MNVNVLAACLTKLVQIKIKTERQTPERAKTLTHVTPIRKGGKSVRNNLRIRSKVANQKDNGR
jgi:hypothetical protein